ncbi:MAG: phosphoenolpyruvate--protein phosphotransferase [Planctomycetia bacterium]|nr:phosphoenolpyruvate--protein phosphotransferase [Planctomycetia bacterium]
MRKGIPVSPGVAVGTAYCIPDIFVDPRGKPLDETEVLPELNRFEAALEATAADLRALYQKVASQVGPSEAEIFRAHEAILHDHSFREKVRDYVVTEKQSASAALRHVMDEYTAIFEKTEDEYLRERLDDVRDVIRRLSGHLSAMLQPGQTPIQGPLIAIAEELLPSHVVALGDLQISGVVTQTGGQTSHAAIIARSRGIPAVTGIRGILRQVATGDMVIVDGRDGHVIFNPDPETEKAYRKLEREFFDLKGHLAENRDHPAVSADGEHIDLLANINNVADCKTAAAMGASGVGLFRTEYLFLTHPDVPDEEEQLTAYRDVIRASPNHRVTIRTLDIGGDKTVPYLGHAREANPFLGWRSIRLSLEHPEFFLTQLRAVLRAAAPEPGVKKNVRLMFPMITTLEELRRVRMIVRRAQNELTAERKPQGEVSIGLMLEVPAAAIMIETFLKNVDYVSVGSNDLVQYLMAADRDNPKVSHLCQPLSPAVLHVLNQVISACRAAGKPVTLCGEMAGAPRAFLLLFGMGLRSFSMSPAFVPVIKDLVSHVTARRAEQIVQTALEFTTSRQIQHYMSEQLREIAPDLSMLESET